tara:strand:+ start:412 stop:627 length:216 start_codon:yes stop_codon:yes gene_type:complete
MLKDIIKLLLFVLILIGALCFDWESFRSSEPFSISSKESPEMEKYLSYLGDKNYDRYASTTSIKELPSRSS